MYLVMVFLHILAVFAFLMAHGVSVAVAFALKRERNSGTHPHIAEPIRFIHRRCTHFPAHRSGSGRGDGLHGQLVGARLDLGLTGPADRYVCLYGPGRVRFLRKGA